MKCPRFGIFFIFFICIGFSGSLIAQEAPSSEDAPAASDTPIAQTNEQNQANAPVEKRLPDSEAKRISALKAQYPAEDLRKISSPSGQFTALWREDRSGKAFGALLIVPTDGQTANWPNTIDVLRTELPNTGWGTLSIDIEPLPSRKAPSRPKDSEPPTEGDTPSTAAAPTDSDSAANTVLARTDPNLARIKAAVEFLHTQGQYNIILAGYGVSAKRILDYAEDTKSTGMKKSMRSNVSKNMQRPIRAMILVNPRSEDGLPIAPLINSFQYKDMPILDLIIGTHYLDTLDATTRKQNARSAGYDTYVQIQMLEPQNVVFGQENRLSRRVRGFLNRYAKGIEIGK